MDGFLDGLPDIGFRNRRKTKPSAESPPTAVIIKCPGCGKENPWTVEKTEIFPGFIRRLRKCKFCGFQMKTRERPEDIGQN